MFKHKTLNAISIISLLIVIALPVYSKYVLFPSYNTFLISQAETILKGIARNMIDKNNIKTPITRDTPLPSHFINDIEHIQKTDGLWKLKLFTPDGQIVYSTDPADVGNQTRKTFFPEMFKGNTLKSHMDTKEIDDGIVPSTHYFIETYVPIIHHDNTPIGAFEIYYDITHIKASFEQLKYTEQKIMGPIIFLLLVGGLFSAYLAHKSMSDLKKSREKFRELSVMDGLTGLLNRRGFSGQIEKQLKIINRSDKLAFLIFIDLNDFKEINDTLGHEIGDAALKETAAILNNTFRDADIIGRMGENVIGRLGGDEFAVLATQISAKSNTEIIRERLENNVLQWNRANTSSYKLSLSFGIAVYSPENPCSVDELISTADTLMYQQKKTHKERRKTANNAETSFVSAAIANS